MDWIERLFGVSPDNGTGSLELGIILSVVSVLLLVQWRRRMRRRRVDA